MNTIVVPLDGSTLTEQVMPYMQTLAPLFDAKVHLLRVLEDIDEELIFTGWAEVAAGMPEPLVLHTDHGHYDWDMRQQHAEGYLGTEVIRLRRASVAAEATVASGLPADTILDFATNEPASLIAMATHGYSGLKRWTIGSVADKVIQAAPCPVFLVRSTLNPNPATYSIRRILVPLDTSALAREALPLAMSLAQRAQAHVFLLQVVPLVRALAMDGNAVPIELDQERRVAALKELTILAKELSAHYHTPMTPLAVLGDAAGGIVCEATRWHIDLIVMSTHGYHGIRRWAMGSVADKVLHASATPLLLVSPVTG